MIVYYLVIQKSITEYSTVQEVFRYAEEAFNEVGQSIVIAIFNLRVCMEGYPLVWNSQEKYKNNIIIIGIFYFIMAYFKMIGKNGWIWFSDVLLEAGTITTGSMTEVMNGKNYSRALNCHKTLTEAIFSLLFQRFIE